MGRCEHKDSYADRPRCILQLGHSGPHMFGNEKVPTPNKGTIPLEYKGTQVFYGEKCDEYVPTEQELKDHDDRYALPGGGTRSEKAPAYHLVPMEGHRRTAIRFALGAEKHGPENWKKSVQTREDAYNWCSEAFNHMMEHSRKMVGGTDPEDDHLGAIGWAQSILCYCEELYGCKWIDLKTEGRKRFE